MFITYDILTTVQLRHQYNSASADELRQGSAFNFVSPELSRQEENKLLNLGMGFKKTSNGFMLFYNTSDSSRADFLSKNIGLLMKDADRQSLSTNEPELEKAVLFASDELLEKMTVSIDLKLKHTDFFNFTGNPDDMVTNSFSNITKSIFYFTNSKQNKNIDQSASFLHSSDVAGARDFRKLRTVESFAADEKDNKIETPSIFQIKNRMEGNLAQELKSPPIADFDQDKEYPDRFFSKPFGVIKLKLLPGLMANYVIQFESKKSFWKYIIQTPELDMLVRDLMDKTDKPAIINDAGEKVFTGPEVIQLNNGRTGLAFTSILPYPARTVVKETLRLVSEFKENDKQYKKILVSRLPSPDYSAVSQIEFKEDNNLPKQVFSEIFL